MKEIWIKCKNRKEINGIIEEYDKVKSYKVYDISWKLVLIERRLFNKCIKRLIIEC